MSENGYIDDDVDYQGIVPAIRMRCPSFALTRPAYRTPHAGILYLNFTVNEVDLVTLCGLVRSGNAGSIAVVAEDGKISYRLGISAGGYFCRQILEIASGQDEVPGVRAQG